MRVSRAVVLERAKEALVVRDVTPRAPGPGEVRLRVEACALGQWDWNLVTLDAPPRLPLVPGVEAVGVVEARGPGVSLDLGARVVVTPLASSCGACEDCQRGEARWCAQARFVGVHFDGALADQVTLPAQHLAPVPALPAAAAACLGGSAWTAVGAVRATGLQPWARLGVFGVGGVGHLVVQAARARGLEVLVDDIDPERKALGLELATSIGGARRPGVEPPAEPPDAGAASFLDGAVVCTPSVQAMQAAVRRVRPGGVVVVVGTSPTGRVDLSLAEVVARGVTVTGCALGSAKDLGDAMGLVNAGVLKPVTRAVPLDEAVARLWQLRDGGYVGRLVFVP